MSKKSGQNRPNDKNDVEPITTVEKILDEITKKFIIRGKPLRIKSRHGVQYSWIQTPTAFEGLFDMSKFVVDFVGYEMPEIRKRFTPSMIEEIWNNIFDMLDFNNSHTTNGLKKRIIKDPKTFVKFERKIDSLTVEEATDRIIAKYDVDLAIDGSFLVISNRRYGEPEPPTGGLGPVFRVANIIESELGYCQPECELTIGVVYNLFEIAKKKKDKPYILDEYAISGEDKKTECKQDEK